MKKRYYGKLAYIGRGNYGTIVEYNYAETKDGIKEIWKIRPVGAAADKLIETSIKPCILTSVKFGRIDNMIAVAIKARGQTYPGYSILSPMDDQNYTFGKRLAVARAMGDCDGINNLLDDDWNNDYIQEYGTGSKRPLINPDDDYKAPAPVSTIVAGENK